MDLGARGEALAAKSLQRAGYRLLARNYTCPVGELDLIAQDGATLVFVEVKTRASAAVADPEINVTPTKRRQLGRVAQYFLAATRSQHHPCRFDVISVVLPPRGEPAIEHFVNAFELRR